MDVVSWLLRMQEVAASRTSEAGYIALSEAIEEVLLLSQEVQNFMVPSIRVLCANRRTGKHIDVRHDMAKDACDAGKVSVVYVRTRTSFKSLDTLKFQKHANINLDVV